MYFIDIPKELIGSGYMDEDPKSETYGDRVLCFPTGKSAGLNGVHGREYLIYTDHEEYDPSSIHLLGK